MPRDITPDELDGSIDRMRRHFATALICRRLIARLGRQISPADMLALEREIADFVEALRRENAEFRDLPAPLLKLLNCGTLAIRFADDADDEGGDYDDA